VEVNAARRSERLVGLPDVTVPAVDDRSAQPIGVSVHERRQRPCGAACASPAWSTGRPTVELADAPFFEGPARLVRRTLR
jgi:hypothetical protein